MYWEGPDRKKVLFWYSRHYMQMQFLFGLPPLPETGEEILPIFLQMYELPDYRATQPSSSARRLRTPTCFLSRPNLPTNGTLYTPSRTCNTPVSMTLLPKLQSSSVTASRPSAAMAARTGKTASAPMLSTPHWSAKTRAAGPSAEKLATISSLVNPRLAVDQDALNEMWDNMV